MPSHFARTNYPALQHTLPTLSCSLQHTKVRIVLKGGN
ncbi:hypothetical protein AZE42_09245 [Rhizopogon vesiculosus]|uniref:Uncharacterized protein n=1 Tax=Rhizopogon vesiculosus TaxID=180088 RepID=A0A1J8QQN4_9AGAM|nr:hypothetical protein AZE42_09245 [Rhizopogon vesiculosus]